MVTGERARSDASVSVSVIVPVYGVEPYLAECLAALVRQNVPGFEIIIVDDGTPDGSPSIYNRFAAQYSYIHLFRQENRGLSAARNAGISLAAGRYISFVDGDDVPAATFLAEMYAAAIYYRADMIECGVSILGEPGPPILDPQIELLSGPTLRRYQRAFVVEGRGSPFAWNKLYRRELLDSRGIRFSGFGCEDYLFNLQVVSAADGVVQLRAPLYGYRVRSGSLSRSFDERFFSTLLQGMKLKLKCMESLGFVDARSQREARSWLLRSLLAHAGSLSESTKMSSTEKRERLAVMLSHEDVKEVLNIPEWGGLAASVVRLAGPRVILCVGLFRMWVRSSLAAVRRWWRRGVT